MWSADQHGYIYDAYVHDGTIIGVHYLDNAFLKVTIKCAGGEIIHICANNISDMNIHDICHGSIVASARIWKCSDAPGYTERVFSPWSILYFDRCHKENINLEASRFSIAHPDAFIFLIDCCYGGAIAAICDNITIQTNADQPA
jgi:hypothetical protein